MNDLMPGPKLRYRLKREAGLMLAQGEPAQQSGLSAAAVVRIRRTREAENSAGGERQTRKIYSLTSPDRRNLNRANQPKSASKVENPKAPFTCAWDCSSCGLQRCAASLAAREPLSAQPTHGWTTARNGIGAYGEEIIQHRREQIKAELNWVTRLRNCKEE